MPLSDIVSVTISDATVVPTRIGFGTPLVLDFNTRFTDSLTRIYKTLAAMASDGFLTTDAAYKMAQKIFSQNPKVKQIRVGRMTSVPQQVIVLTPIAADNTDYSVTINSTVKTINSGVGASAASIATALATEIGVTDGVTATDTAGTVTLTGTNGVAFQVAVTRALLTQQDTTGDSGIVADLQAIQAEENGDDFYSIHPTFGGAAIIEALAAYVETIKKILVTEGSDDAELAGTGIGAFLKTAAYFRTAFSYTGICRQYLGAAWAGKLLPLDPGSATWAYKTLSGILPDTLTATEMANLEAKNVNYYTTIAGLNVMRKGITSGGEWIDVVQGIDWETAIIQEDIFAAIASMPKVPYTDPGIQVIESVLSADLKRGVAKNFLAADPPFVITVPLVKDIDASDKANRLLPDITFSAPLAGAIHAVEITGTVSV